jgi:hypothetical protein
MRAAECAWFHFECARRQVRREKARRRIVSVAILVHVNQHEAGVKLVADLVCQRVTEFQRLTFSLKFGTTLKG